MGLVIYIRDWKSRGVTEISTNMKVIIWLGVEMKKNSQV
jgi:hypothetical protein